MHRTLQRSTSPSIDGSSTSPRRLHNPSNEVTYLVDRNINYTNVCTINCQFCSFYRPPGHDETYTQSYEEIRGRIDELEAIGGSRILMQGGVNPSLDFDWYIELIKELREHHPTIDLDCFHRLKSKESQRLPICQQKTFSLNSRKQECMVCLEEGLRCLLNQFVMTYLQRKVIQTIGSG